MNSPAHLTGTLQIFTDGGSRGNPGPAACAFSVRHLPSQKIIFEQGRYLGITTNNVAEYRGIISALSWVASEQVEPAGKVEVYSDSLLVVNQINGMYKVKDENLRPLFTQVIQTLTIIKQKFPQVTTFQHIPRSLNHRADQLVNITLDRQTT